MEGLFGLPVMLLSDGPVVEVCSRAVDKLTIAALMQKSADAGGQLGGQTSFRPVGTVSLVCLLLLKPIREVQLSTPDNPSSSRSYAGDITPDEAWKLLSDNPDAVLVDCRTDAEWRFVGVADISGLGRDVVYVEWSRVDGRRNERFVDELKEAGVSGEKPVVFLCRSGNRSIGAAEAATAAGIAPSYNVLDGFEGHLDPEGHRGGSGWRAVGLPWRQS